jgi:hypothetical protein
MGGRDVMGNVEKGDIEVDGWCVVDMVLKVPGQPLRNPKNKGPPWM